MVSPVSLPPVRSPKNKKQKKISPMKKKQKDKFMLDECTGAVNGEDIAMPTAEEILREECISPSHKLLKIPSFMFKDAYYREKEIRDVSSKPKRNLTSSSSKALLRKLSSFTISEEKKRDTQQDSEESCAVVVSSDETTEVTKSSFKEKIDSKTRKLLRKLSSFSDPVDNAKTNEDDIGKENKSNSSFNDNDKDERMKENPTKMSGFSGKLRTMKFFGNPTKSFADEEGLEMFDEVKRKKSCVSKIIEKKYDEEAAIQQLTRDLEDEEDEENSERAKHMM